MYCFSGGVWENVDLGKPAHHEAKVLVGQLSYYLVELMSQLRILKFITMMLLALIFSFSSTLLGHVVCY